MKSTFRKLLSLLLCLALMICLTCFVFADGGDFGGDADFGGDDGGGGDWGGGWDDGGDWDSDSSTRSSGGPVSNVTFIIVAVIIIIIVVRSKVQTPKNHRRITTAAPTPIPSLQDINSYRDLDPGFDPAQLGQRISNFYIQFQQCWQQKNIESLRPFFTDTYYAQLDRQLQTYRDRGITNYVDRPTVLSVNLDGFCQGGGDDHIYATVRTRIVDYKVEDATQKVVSGSKTQERFMTYRYHLIRPSGLTSDTIQGTRSLSCPHCGAPLNINESAKCPFCDSVITVEKHDFVIAQIEAISQVTA